MPPRISISLPSIYGPALERTLKNIRDATRNSYEVILVSPIQPPIDEEHVVWIEEKEGTGTGCNAGHAAAYPRMTGDFLTPWVDDHFYVDGWDALAIQNYEDREKAFGKKGKPFVLGLRHAFPHHVGTEFGIYYPYFPFIRRSYVKNAKGWFDAAYKKGFADSDLALRVWAAGGRCEWSDHALVTVHSDDSRKVGIMFEQSDMDLFVSRWAPKYGEGWSTSTIRDFNLDIEPYYFPELSVGNTVYHNEPGFRDLALGGGWRPNGAAVYLK